MIILDLLEASIGYNYKLIIFDTQLDPIHTPNNHQDKHNGEIKCPRRVYTYCHATCHLTRPISLYNCLIKMHIRN